MRYAQLQKISCYILYFHFEQQPGHHLRHTREVNNFQSNNNNTYKHYVNEMVFDWRALLQSLGFKITVSEIAIAMLLLQLLQA